MHTEKIPPYITLKRLDKSSDSFDVRPGNIKRDILNETYSAHGYMCQPVSTAGLNGWEFVLKEDVTFIWDGISDSSADHVKILSKTVLDDGNIFIDTGTANATIAFNLSTIIETDPDHYVYLMGPPNYFIDGVQPMNAILQSNWYHFNSIQFCWRITRANEEITIPAGTPFMFMMNYPKNLLESTTFTVREATSEESERMESYNSKRSEFYENSEDWKWHQMYKHGVESPHTKHLSKPFKPAPSKVIEERP